MHAETFRNEDALLGAEFSAVPATTIGGEELLRRRRFFGAAPPLIVEGGDNVVDIAAEGCKIVWSYRRSLRAIALFSSDFWSSGGRMMPVKWTLELGDDFLANETARTQAIKKAALRSF